jgi:hypothetical protein
MANVPIHARGQVVVSFHGDAAAGCSTYGLCPYSGTIVVRPRAGELFVATYRLHGRIRHLAAATFDPGESQSTTAARVDRSVVGQPGGVCADTAANAFGEVPTSVHGRSLRIGLFAPGGQTLSTRCAGPLDGDLAGAGPSITVPLQRAAHGRTTLDLTGTRAFASHGFAGTVTSTLVLALGRPESNQSQSAPPPAIKTRRQRIVTERLTLIHVSGQLTATVQGSSVPVPCRLLDSCGLTGTLSFGGVAHGFTGVISVTGPASRPYRDFLAALGLGRGQPRGLTGDLFANWALGPVTESVSQSGTCTDSSGAAQMFLAMPARGTVLRGSAGWGGARTRCPGPSTANQNPVLSAVLARSALGRRELTITLRPAGSLVDDGYTASLRGHLTLTLRRGRIRQQVFAAPVG